MEASSSIQFELLKRLFNLRIDVNKAFAEKGPASPRYIELSKGLDQLYKRYNEELLLHQINILKDKMITTWIDKGFNHHETIDISQKLDEVLIRYQKAKHVG